MEATCSRNRNIRPTTRPSACAYALQMFAPVDGSKLATKGIQDGESWENIRSTGLRFLLKEFVNSCMPLGDRCGGWSEKAQVLGVSTDMLSRVSGVLNEAVMDFLALAAPPPRPAPGGQPQVTVLPPGEPAPRQLNRLAKTVLQQESIRQIGGHIVMGQLIQMDSGLFDLVRQFVCFDCGYDPVCARLLQHQQLIVGRSLCGLCRGNFSLPRGDCSIAQMGSTFTQVHGILACSEQFIAA